ncbi:unnamed protein product [Mytilus coruscus]|uniref:Uncharacterized protein n=1 Tax=Mytilus coruscus TaxID=42192 RepID=A0A6J8A8D2_MYTCO|nr:unnamed protein product [Mytilus coruscus]
MEAYSYAGGHHRPTRGPVTTDSLMPNIPENKTMDVTFHVALSKKKWDTPQGKSLMLIVTNEDEEIAGHTLRMTDETDSKYLEFATSFTIAEPSHFTSLEYKYVFLLDDGSKVPEHRHGCALPSAKRHLNLNKCSGTDKTYHRYDGIVRNKKSKKVFENNDTKLKNDMEKAAQFFIRKINIASSSNSFQGLNGEQLILRLEMLKKGMEEVYWGANENGRKERSSLLKQIMTTAFKPLLEDIRRNCHKEEDTRLMMLINATLVAYCLVKQIVELSDDDKELMCKALLPRMDQEKKCPDLIVLNKAFPNTMSQMISALHSLSKTMICRPGKLSWIYIMPLIHFMDKKCIPWQEAPDDINHDAKVPHWWGIVLGEHKLDFETFKSVRIERYAYKYT